MSNFYTQDNIESKHKLSYENSAVLHIQSKEPTIMLDHNKE